jgi:hypothetical protein
MTISRAVPPSDPSPVGIHPGRQLVATDDMDLDPFVLASQPDDPVAGNRMAAGGKVIGDARCQALDRDGGALAERARRDIAAGRSGHQCFHQLDVRHGPARDLDHQRVGILDLQRLDRPLERLGTERCGQARDNLIIDFPAELNRLIPFLVANEAAYARAGLAGDDEA